MTRAALDLPALPSTCHPGKTVTTARRRASRIAVVLAITAAAAQPAAAASPTKGRTYEAGHGGSATYAHFQVSRRGGALTDISLEIRMPCSNRRDGFGLFEGAIQSPPARLVVAHDGSFSGTFALSPDEMLDPFVRTEQYWLSGTFVRHGKAARLTVRGRQVGEGGTVCDSTDRHVTAKRLANRRALR